MSPEKRPFKLSATSLSCFLESPKAFYFRYIKRMEPLQPSVMSFDHDKICGVLWAEWVDGFYKGVPEAENTKRMLAAWDSQTDGWVGKTTKDKLTEAMKAWAGIYCERYSPKDGIRNGSEKFVENERFLGYLDGLSADHQTIHEVKSTSRAKSTSEQLWKVQRSIQVKLYTVLTGASGVLIEFAYKDTPHDIYRAPVLPITKAERDGWEKELNSLADYIYSLGDDPNKYVCHPDSCCIISKGFTSICGYQSLCEKVPGAEVAFKLKQSRENRKVNP